MIDLSDKKITGYWGNEPIWREFTPEERLEENQQHQKYPLKKEEVMTYLALLANRDNRHI